MAIDEEITLKKLEVFLAFMRLGSLARVAEEQGQSTVSVHRALHSLEEGLRCPLFKREGRNLTALPTAYALAKHAQRAVGECEEGIRKVRELAGFDAGRMRIGSLYSLTLRCIPQLLIALKLRKPDLQVDLTLGSNEELLRSLADGRLDAVVIGVQQALEDKDLIAVPLFEDEVMLAAPLGSPYAGLARIDLQTMRDEKFITLGGGFVTADSFQHAFRQAGFVPETVMRVGDIFSLINLVSGGIGYSLLPGRVAEFSSRIQLIPLEARYVSHQRITLLLPRNRERDPNLLALAAECRMYGKHSPLR
ncbi:LysR family transcriptional regulator [Pseudoduganella namucuonensis]|uniref:LysR family transcriptional regulator, malonate utilization transcriptional regulator n=1 Tax=Pseudoduganella namucuonensis TaxID=1035707 RepID=A0A1I7KRU1_9BURK|nr:LysR family transcriptional regulator [Pseudoduganella namucuonensis]SFV00118.1 LysR family transcriptional regulator, malonate utilization transcriptional regulator [Pseudoduganella namucuonensis]